MLRHHRDGPIGRMADVQQQSQQTQQDPLQSIPSHANSSLAPTSALDDRPPKRRASLSPTERAMAAASGARTLDAQKKSKGMSYRGSNANARGSVMTMPGMIGGEITYTPTTHRISKAKKGKKVHACEFPGCTKVRDLRWRGANQRFGATAADHSPDLHPSRASQVCHQRTEIMEEERSLI